MLDTGISGCTETCPKFISIKKCLARPFIKVPLLISTKCFTFSRIGKNPYMIKKGQFIKTKCNQSPS
jgi:hypothetical protein